MATWICEKDNFETEWSDKDVAERGTPVCPTCDEDMELKEEKKDTWTVTVELTVFAGDMDKSNVIGNAEKVLTDITDGSDFCGFTVIDAKRDE